jgi:hypothetical protein
MTVAERHKAPIDLGLPQPGEQVRRVTYWYVRSIPDSYAKYLHVYELEPKDRDMLRGGAAPGSRVEAAGRVRPAGGAVGVPGSVTSAGSTGWHRAARLPGALERDQGDGG